MFRTAAIQSLRRVAKSSIIIGNNGSIITTTTSFLSSSSIATRSLATAAQKRALSKDQISGKDGAQTGDAVGENGTTTTTASTNTPSGSSSSSSAGGGVTSPPPPPSGGGSSILPIIALAAIGGGGAAYYMDLIPMGGNASDGAGQTEKKVKEETPKLVVETVEEEAKEKVVVKEEEKEAVAKEEIVVVAVEEEEEKTPVFIGNRVLNIHAPPASERDSNAAPPPPPVEHDPNGSRVSVEKFNQVYGSSSSQEETSEPSPSKEETSESSSPTSEIALQAEKELTSSITSSKIDDALKEAHATMRATLNESFLKDLDKLSESELRIRIVQLASEMGERTKWEAVRLREFLAMKEKEVADKFLDLMHKQRLEFEDLLSRRLREQEYNLTKQANDTIDAKNKEIESIIDSVTTAQQSEHDATLKSTEERLNRELSAQFEADFGKKLAEAKLGFLKEMEEKVSIIESVTSRLEKNEQNLEISRNFENGSQRAHKVSAAALALAEKMESSQGALEEFVALKTAAAENGVIASALSKIPDTVKEGIPTVAELQTTFDECHNVTRQAVYVPSGQSGVEGQIAGFIFAKLRGQPSPDSMPPASSDSDDISESYKYDLILARAKQYVKLGQLEEAIHELDQLKGQAAYVVNDWKVTAMNRIAVDQALKVIKLECALMNKNMAG